MPAPPAAWPLSGHFPSPGLRSAGGQNKVPSSSEALFPFRLDELCKALEPTVQLEQKPETFGTNPGVSTAPRIILRRWKSGVFLSQASLVPRGSLDRKACNNHRWKVFYRLSNGRVVPSAPLHDFLSGRDGAVEQRPDCSPSHLIKAFLQLRSARPHARRRAGVSAFHRRYVLILVSQMGRLRPPEVTT